MSFKRTLFFTSCIAAILVLPVYAICAPQPIPASSIEFTEKVRIEVNEVLLSVAWSPSGNSILVSGEEGIYVYSPEFERVGSMSFEEAEFVLSTVWGPDGEKAASLTKGGQVYIWSVDDGTVLDTWQARGVPASIAWSPDGSKIAVGSTYGYGIVTIYDTASGEYQEVLSAETNDEDLGPVKSVVWHPNSRWLGVSTFLNTPFLIWDTVTSRRVTRTLSSRIHFIVAWNPDGTLLALAGLIPQDYDIPDQAVIYIWPTEATKPLRTVLVDEYGELGFDSLAWHPEGSLFAAHNYDEQIRIWDTNTWQLVTKLAGVKRRRDYPSYNSLAWSPDGAKLADVGDGLFRVWGSAENW